MYHILNGNNESMLKQTEITVEIKILIKLHCKTSESIK